jgi:hypothetical protein
MDSDFMSIFKNHGAGAFRRMGINDASTFTGFCGAHDNWTFAPVEQRSLIPDAEQCFLMSYVSHMR